jgi:hypothetical protein
MAQAVLFPGSFSATSYTMAALNDYVDGSYVLQGNLNYYNYEHDRAGSTAKIPLTYYIQVTTNITSLITPHPAGTIKAADGTTVQDDVWSFAGANFTNSTSNIDVSYNLPVISNVSVPIKSYKAYFYNNNAAGTNVQWTYIDDASYNTVEDTSGNHSGIDVVTLDTVFSSDTDGVISAVTSFNDISGGFDVKIPENIAFAQVLSLDFGSYATKVSTLPGDSTNDVSQFIITDASLNADAGLVVKRNAVNALYNNQNILASWSITFDAQPASGRADASFNTITNYARDTTQNWTTSQYGFVTGERIVTTGKQSFSLSVNDGNSNPVTLISAADIYGVLRQS